MAAILEANSQTVRFDSGRPAPVYIDTAQAVPASPLISPLRNHNDDGRDGSP